LHDLGLRNVLAVTIFSFGLCFSILVPLTMPIMLVLFKLGYYLEKYNLFYVSPLDFESEVMNRRILVLATFWGIILFQVVTILIVSTVVESQATVYMILMVLVEIMTFAFLFAFFRSPWKGAYLMTEEAEKI
jgi:hypothetical protein